MARLLPNGVIKYGQRELESIPGYGARDTGHGGMGMLDPLDPAESVGLLPGQTLSHQLFPEMHQGLPDEMVQIAQWLMGSGNQRD